MDPATSGSKVVLGDSAACIRGLLRTYTGCETLVYMATPTEPDHGVSPPSATVTVKGPGVEIVRPVDEATLAQVIALLFGTAPPGPMRNQAPPGGGGGGGGASLGGGDTTTTWDPDLTLGEFLAETKASTFPQKICAAGYYLTKVHGAESFDREGIRTALVQAHENLPGNFARDFSNAASANLIAQKPGENGKYFVPTTGRKAVDSHFQEVPRRRTRSTRKAGATSKGHKSE